MGFTMSENLKHTPGDLPDPNEVPHREEWLDKAIADSMVASDPIAAVSKGEATSPPRWPYDGEDEAAAPDDAPSEEELDEALADSMIASDPVAVVSKGEPSGPPRRPVGEPAAPDPADAPRKPGAS